MSRGVKCDASIETVKIVKTDAYFMRIESSSAAFE